MKACEELKPMMKKKNTVLALTLPLAMMTTACTQNMSPHSYDSHAVGEARRVERGVIDSYRWVEIRGDSKVGTAVGVGVGAAAGSTVGNSGAENVIGAIGGALLGGLLGSSIDKSANKKSGFEYLIRTESGSLISILQEDRHPFAEGTPVVIVFSRDRSRVVLDHSAYEDNRGVETTQRYRDVPPIEPFDEDDVIEPKGN
jgi:outer membrane lipoprotein SlyB